VGKLWGLRQRHALVLSAQILFNESGSATLIAIDRDKYVEIFFNDKTNFLRITNYITNYIKRFYATVITIYSAELLL